ncbi:MAG: hypothetical protein J6Y82_00590 [Bacteroidales bacterium]|nr:hypothetical protein [Bacteroidales bacterium]
MKKIIFSAAVLAMAAIGVLKATSTNDYTFNELQMENICALGCNKCERVSSDTGCPDKSGCPCWADKGRLYGHFNDNGCWPNGTPLW